MDILTHGMMGVALAGPLLGTYPAEASGFILGSVLPDLDSLSRCFGKRAFLRWHQGWTHSFLVVGAVGAGGFGVMQAAWPEAAGIFVGLALGAVLHVCLDLTNTYGVQALAPFSSRRFCWESIFFLDAGVIALTAPAAVLVWMFGDLHAAPRWIALFYATTLFAYVAARIALRRYACRWCSADTVSIVPSALWPWEYFVCDRRGQRVCVRRLSALSGRQAVVLEQPIFDAAARKHLPHIPEYHAMQALSPAYHVVRYEQTPSAIHIRCRDLRIVNFNTNFGVLDAAFSTDGTLTSVKLQV